MIPTLQVGFLRDCGSISGRGKRFISSSERPDWLWGLPSLACNGYWELIPWR